MMNYSYGYLVWQRPYCHGSFTTSTNEYFSDVFSNVNVYDSDSTVYDSDSSVYDSSVYDSESSVYDSSVYDLNF